MVIDSKPIRAKARREYRRVLRAVERAQKELEQFEKHDRPHFSRWLNREFGNLVRELQEFSARLTAQRELLAAVQAEAFHSSCSHVQAYERVMEMREQPPGNKSNPTGDDRTGEQSGGSGRASGNPDDDPFARFRERFQQAFAATRSQRPDAARLKELYRALARRLHPDSQGNLSNKRKEWWHQAQAAYESGDVEQLQAILTLCEIDERGIKETSLSLLARLTLQFKDSLRRLKLQLKRVQTDPAWHFSEVSDLSGLARRTERLLTDELSDVKRVLSTLDAQIANWERQARTPKRQSSARNREGGARVPAG